MRKHFLLQDIPQGKEGDMLLLREQLIITVTEKILEEAEKRGLNLSDLGRKIGKSRAQISRWLNGDANMTLRSLSDLSYAMDLRPVFALTTEGCTPELGFIEEDAWSAPSRTLKFSQISAKYINNIPPTQGDGKVAA